MPFEGASTASDCIPCLAGYTCIGTQNWDITDVAQLKPCTAGQYCPAGGVEIPCP